MPVERLLWNYSMPAIVGIVVMSLYNIVDRIFIGQGVGPDAIAGLAITFPVMNLATALGMLIGAGSVARISIVLGQGNKDMAWSKSSIMNWKHSAVEFRFTYRSSVSRS